MNGCKHVLECGSCTLNLPYEEQIAFKKNFIKDEFGDFFKGEFEFFASPPSRYRCRAEFGIWRESDDLYYTMYGSKTRRIMIDECLKVAEPIADLMPRLLCALTKNRILK